MGMQTVGDKCGFIEKYSTWQSTVLLTWNCKLRVAVADPLKIIKPLQSGGVLSCRSLLCRERHLRLVARLNVEASGMPPSVGMTRLRK
jgi:hypothetical protein